MQLIVLVCSTRTRDNTKVQSYTCSTRNTGVQDQRTIAASQILRLEEMWRKMNECGCLCISAAAEGDGIYFGVCGIHCVGA